MKKIIFGTAIIFLFLSCKENYFDGKFDKLHEIVFNGNELIETETYYGDDFGRFYIRELFTALNGKIYYCAVKYEDLKREFYNSIIGEIDINGNILWRYDLKDLYIYGFAEDDKNNVFVYGTTTDWKNSMIGKIETQSIDIIFKSTAISQFTSLRHIENNTFLFSGLWNVGENSVNGGIGALSINQNNVEIQYFAKYRFYSPYIYTWEKTNNNTFSITLPGTTQNQWGVAKVEWGIGDNDPNSLTWTSDPIIADYQTNHNLESSYADDRGKTNVYVKNGNDLVVVGYGDNAENRTYLDVNSKIPRGIVACLDYQSGAIKWQRAIPENNSEIDGTKIYQIIMHNNKYYVIGVYNTYNYKYRSFGCGFIQTISLSGKLLDCYLFGKDFEYSMFSSATIVGNKLLIAGLGGQKFSKDNPYNNLFVSYDGYKGWFVSCNINDF